MKIAVLGTGVVGNTIGSKLIELGHSVMMGSRTSDNPKAAAWVASAGANASQGTFAGAAQFGEVIFNCTSGLGSLDALRQAGAENLKGKIIIDLANSLDVSNGFPPTLGVCNTDSLAEEIQRAFPDAKVVKTLNTVNCKVMVDPSLIPGDHTIFVSGNDPEAKATVTGYLNQWFGWPEKNILDLGDITSARATEMFLPLWLRTFGAMQNPNVNVHVVAGPKPVA
jgi:predicted dinucleotide-binding enzyme